MKVLVTGASGLIGTALIASLNADGQEAIPLRRQRLEAATPVWDPEQGIINLGGVSDITAVVHLAGENIARGRWSRRQKTRILNSRIRGTGLLADYCAGLDHKPDVILSASAVGFYGDRGEASLTETSSSGEGFLPEVCRQWEGATATAAAAGIRVVNLRLGAVLSTSDGVLKQMLLPFRMGLGGTIGSGRQYMSWVHIDDVVAMIRFIIDHDSLRGPVNLVAPQAVSNRRFIQTLGRLLRRPTLLRLPAWAVRLAFGEMGTALLLASTRALPGKLCDSGYRFLHPELDAALTQLLKPVSTQSST